MACYLTLTGEEHECEGCARTTGPGLVGLTDEIGSPPHAVVCHCCLDGLDRGLAAVWQLIREGRCGLGEPGPGSDPQARLALDAE